MEATPSTRPLGRWLKWRWYRIRLHGSRFGLCDHPNKSSALSYSRHNDDLLAENAAYTPTSKDDISTISYSTVEYYAPSDIVTLRNSMRRLRLGRSWISFGDPSDWVTEARSAEHPGGWMNLGQIHRKSDRRIFGMGVRGPVPPAFDYVALRIQSLSPSLTACSFTFYLKAQERRLLKQALARYRFPEFRAHKDRSYSVLAPSDLKKQQVAEIREAHRVQIHRWIRAHLPGFLAHEPADLRPFVELSTYRQAVEGRGTMWEPIGLEWPVDAWDRQGSGRGRLIFLDRLEMRRKAHAALFVRMDDITEEVLAGYGNDEAAIAHKLADELGVLVSAWGLSRLLRAMRHRLSQARDNQLGLRRAGAGEAIRRLQAMTTQNADIQLICNDLRSRRRSRAMFDRYVYVGGEHANPAARPNLMEWFTKSAVESAKKLIDFDDNVRTLAQQQGTLLVASQNLFIQQLVFCLTIITVILGLVAAFDPAIRIIESLGLVPSRALAVLK